MDIAEFKQFVGEDESVRIFICHGPPRCDGKDEPCQWCKVIHADDQRSTDEIMSEMKRSQ